MVAKFSDDQSDKQKTANVLRFVESLKALKKVEKRGTVISKFKKGSTSSFAHDYRAKRKASTYSASAGAGGIFNKNILSIPKQGHSKGHSPAHSITSPKNSGSFASGSSGGSSGGGSHDSADNVRRRHRRKKAKKSKNKKDNVFTHMREYIAQSDVFVAKHDRPPHVTCIHISLYAIPIFFIFLLWDTLAVTAFETPHLSMLDHPGFLIVFQFMCILLPMYGYCVQCVTCGDDDRETSLAKISLACHYLLFLWRAFLELYFDGYRYQEKSYLPRTRSSED